MRFDASLASGRSHNLEDKLGLAAKAAEDAEFGTARLRREVNDMRMREGDLQGCIDTLQKQLQEESHEVESLRKELTAAYAEGRYRISIYNNNNLSLAHLDDSPAALDLSIAAIASACCWSSSA